MKRCEALALREGDLVDVRAPRWQGGRAYGCKVLVVSSRGGVYITGGQNCWGERARWVQYHHVVALGEHEELTEKERAIQFWELERFQAYRERTRQKASKYYLRNRTPQELYNFLWNELEDGEGCALEALQAKARARGLQADAATWQRVGRVLGYSAENPQFWRMPLQRAGSVIVMPGKASDCRSVRPFDHVI